MQIARLSATIAAGAANQAVPHGLDRAPTLIFIVEKDEAEGPKKALYAQCQIHGAIAIATLAPQIQTVAASQYSVAGVMYDLAATDNFWDLTGFNVTNALYNICLLAVDDAGNDQIGIGTEAALLANVVLADTPADSCVIAMVEVNPTGAGNFVGGTSDLDDAGIVPNAVYTDLSGHPDLFGEITEGNAADATNVYINNSMMSARDVEIIVNAVHSITL